MQKIAKMNVWGLAKFQSILLGLIGLLAGIFYAVGGAIYDLFTIGLNWGTLLAFLALPGMPLLFSGIGFLLGILEAILFNLIWRWSGRIDIQLEA